MSTYILVPAYKPSQSLVDLVAALDDVGVHSIVVVDDGSGPDHAGTFERVTLFKKVRLLRHIVNLGKGAALKTGINHCLCEDPQAVIVTADADGQHLPADILRVAEQGALRPDALVLGARAFEGNVPLRSRIGNLLTRLVLRVVLGYALTDTQTGLRAIPHTLARDLLKLASRRYEFELDMLVLSKQLGVPILQTPIRTVYLDGNVSSHFNPLLDSARIYFVLVRYLLASLSTAVLDNLAFAMIYAAASASTRQVSAIVTSQAGARLVAMAYNYAAVKRLVFASKQSHWRVIPKYILLVAGSAAVSLLAISSIRDLLGWKVIAAKVVVETLLFFPNFVIQRELVFRAPIQEAVAEIDD